ncbi:MAG: hypothetical protein IPJ68_04045 [Candidatus Moraniibacteriota bacterium]|nr:MAG: hypothetical protein IPJ68_04045 [Candidatus Moranbacteria bacterium]
MDESKDPLLSEQEGVSTGGYEYSFVAIPKRHIVIVAAYIQLIWKVKNFEKTVSPEQVLENTKSLFRENQDRISDSLWKEHCAGSLRELLDCHMSDLPYALASLPPQTNSTGQREQIYADLQLYKEFLNDLAHLQGNSALKNARLILGDTTLADIDDRVFDKICTQFIDLLYSLFRQHCMKGD